MGVSDQALDLLSGIAPGNGTMTFAMVTLICGSSSRGVATRRTLRAAAPIEPEQRRELGFWRNGAQGAG